MGSSEFAFFQKKNHRMFEKKNSFAKVLPTENKGQREQFEGALQKSCLEELGRFQQKIHVRDSEKYATTDDSCKCFEC